MRTEVYDVPHELVEAIEARQLELNGLKNMWAFSVSNTEYFIPQEKIDLLKQDIINKNTEYELLKRELEKMFKDKYNNYSWKLDFDSYKVTVEVND